MSSEQAVDLLQGENEDLVAEAKDVLGEEYAEYWLMTENRRFGGERPIDWINSGNAAKRKWVHDVLGAIKYGVFA